MKALTLTQPWATLVARGLKQYETRSWSTRYRGLLAIHAAKSFPAEAQDLCFDETGGYISGMLNTPPWELPRGGIIAVVRLVGCIHTEDAWNLSDQERAFGDYSPGRYAWQLLNAHELQYPIACKGMLGLWTVPPSLEALL